MKKDACLVEKSRQGSIVWRLRGPQKQRTLIGFCVLLCCASLFFSLFLSARYQQDQALAFQGRQELQIAASQLQALEHDAMHPNSIAIIRHHFALASTAFTSIHNDLRFAPDALALLPGIGSRMQAIKHLVTLATDTSQGGEIGCTIIQLLLSGLNRPQGLRATDLIELGVHIHQLNVILHQSDQEVQQLSPANLRLDPSIRHLLETFHHDLPSIQRLVQQAETLTSSLPALLGIGSSAYYLVEILDSTELRPGGGFIGNYGIATLTGGHMVSARVTDTYLLDNSSDRTNTRPYPPEYKWFQRVALNKWSLRDSNLDADFPTTARNATKLYAQEGGKLPLSGVLAITPAFIEHLLTLTGPIVVPAYHETITAQNLVARIHYHQLIEEAQLTNTPSADGYSSTRKHFTALLGAALVKRMQTLSVASSSMLLRECLASLQTRDLQIYFQAESAEQILHAYQMDGALQAPAHDGIFVVNANLTPSKANQFLTTTIHDRVTLDRAGTAFHQTHIEFQWTGLRVNIHDFYGSTLYRDYLRVYVPLQSVLLSQSGWRSDASGQASGSTFWSGYLVVDYPEAKTVSFTWQMKHAAIVDAQHWHYQELLQHQAGAQQQMDLRITLPACGTLVVSSSSSQVNNQRSLSLDEQLTQNKLLSIDYTCREEGKG